MVAVKPSLSQDIAGSRIVPTKKDATEHIGTQTFTLKVIHTFYALLTMIEFRYKS